MVDLSEAKVYAVVQRENSTREYNPEGHGGEWPLNREVLVRSFPPPSPSIADKVGITASHVTRRATRSPKCPAEVIEVG